MTASTRAKGNAKEKEIVDLFRAAAWAVQRAPLTAKFIGPGRVVSVASDFFGTFDLVAKRRGDQTVWAQVTFEHHAAKRRRKIEEFAEGSLTLGGVPGDGFGFDRALLFVWFPRRHFRVFEFDGPAEWIEIGTIEHGLATDGRSGGPSLTYLLSPRSA